MSKLTLNDVASLESQTSALATMADNNEAIEAAVENTLSRDGTTPNQMEAVFDMNNYRIINLGEPVNANDAVRFVDIGEISTDALIQAGEDAEAVAAALVLAEGYADDAAASAAAAAGYIGAATSAATLTTPRTISVGTDATGGVSFDGSSNVTIPVTLVASGVSAATYGSGTQIPVIAVDAKGRVTSASNVTIVSAPKLTTARSITLTGPVTGTTSFDGSGNVNIATTVTSAGPYASASISVAATVLSINNSAGFASITRTGTGKIQFVFTTPASNAYYKVMAMAQRQAINSFMFPAFDYLINPTVNGFSIDCEGTSGAALADPGRLDVVVFE